MMHKKIGLFFGSFNPIHIGHLILANHMVEYSDLDQVWLVVSPHNPFKEKKSLLDDNQRLHMVRLAIEDYPKLKESKIEFDLPQPSYTIDTLTHLKEKFIDHEFSLILGEDNLVSFHKWKNHELILKNHKLLVYPRIHNGKEPKIDSSSYEIINAPIVGISSTQIRQMIKEKKNYKPLLPQKVFDYLDGSSLYQIV